MTLLTTPPVADGNPSASPTPPVASSSEAPVKSGEQTAPGGGTTPSETKAAEKGTTTTGGSDKQPTGDAKAAPTGAPETYELKPTAEGFVLADQPKNALTEVARELNLSNEAVQKIVDKMAPALQLQGKSSVEAMVQGWHDETMADPEIGGAKLKETQSFASRALSHVPPGLRKLLGPVSEGGTGLGNHRDVLAGFAALGRMLAPDTKVVTGREASPPPKSAMERLAASYGTPS